MNVLIIILAIIIIVGVIICIKQHKQHNQRYDDIPTLIAKLNDKINFVKNAASANIYGMLNNLDIPVYYINLKRSPKRNEEMQTQLRWGKIQLNCLFSLYHLPLTNYHFHLKTNENKILNLSNLLKNNYFIYY